MQVRALLSQREKQAVYALRDGLAISALQSQIVSRGITLVAGIEAADLLCGELDCLPAHRRIAGVAARHDAMIHDFALLNAIDELPGA